MSCDCVVDCKLFGQPDRLKVSKRLKAVGADWARDTTYEVSEPHTVIILSFFLHCVKRHKAIICYMYGQFKCKNRKW